MKLSTAAAQVWNHETTSTAIPQPINDETGTTDDIIDDANSKEVYLVTVDSRQEESPSNLKCFIESTCKEEFFRDHILDDPHMICIESQVARMCGLDIKLHFHYDPNRPQPHSSNLHRTNAAATLLLFHPETQKFVHIVHGKAYALWNNGQTPLSKRQVWGLVELIREARVLYEEKPADEAHKQLLEWCSLYQHETWVPHGIYEDRKTRAHHRRHHHGGNKDHHNSVDKEKILSRLQAKELERQESGVTDAATCHHGECHGHHVVTADHNEFIEILPLEEDNCHHRHHSEKKRDSSGDAPDQIHSTLDRNYQCFSLPVV
ncbi:hypothetical protein IV203_016800 [Nitzschia inconspicua]|uniref:Uncharacterized protein n=1 Tax=Nitzschia inconspicua TaxID=303405 RepID=A0A9K3KQQ2_9STRA|nr:hypothetical protein IV203_016800 [Nitzschia inconspicua]